MGKAENILISGAGIAGLSLARQLKKLNISFTIIEKKPALATDGAGIALPANAVSALRYLGLGDQIEQHAHRVTQIIYTKPSGNILSQASLLDHPLNSDCFVALHRNKLHEILRDGIEDIIHFHTTIKNIQSTSAGVRVDFDSPTLVREEYSAIIGADGIYSSVRQSAFGEINLIDHAVSTWRWICEYPTEHLQPTYMLGEQDIFMAYPIGKNSVYCYAHIFDKENKIMKSDNHRQMLTKTFRQYDGIASEILQILPQNEAIIPGRLRSVPKPFFSKGRIALIGDASNACSPILQQGAACALEGAVVLSELLSQYSTEIALNHYAEYRRDRVSWIIQASDGPIKTIAKMNSYPALFARNMFIKFKGPLNVQGWKKLLSENPFAKLSRNHAIDTTKINQFEV